MTNKKQKGNWRLVLAGVILGSVITVGAFWITPIVIKKARTLPDWTGFGETKVITTTKEKDKKGQIQKTTISEQPYYGITLRELLELAGTLAVPILIFIFGLWFQQRENKRAEEQAKLERGIAKDNLAEEAIQAYLDNMAKLLLDKELRKDLFPNVKDKFNLLDKDNPVRDIARTQTITILRRLEGDKKRQDRIINFLRDAELYSFILKNVNLSRANLQEVDLRDANLRDAKLSSTDLSSAYLRDANLSSAYLWSANLSSAYLWSANLSSAYLRDADLSSAYLRDADLTDADLFGANLFGANLFGANLFGANLIRANLSSAHLIRANLRDANLRDANLIRAYLWSANLENAKLAEAKNLTSSQIKSTCYWEQATYKQDKEENKKYIEELKKDKSSDPIVKPDCSKWER